MSLPPRNISANDHLPRHQVLPIIGIALNGANVYGYVRCRYGAAQGLRESLGSATSGFVREQMMKNVSVLRGGGKGKGRRGSGEGGGRWW